MKGSRTVGLPLGNPDTALVQAKPISYQRDGRLGYAFDNVLLYGKGGLPWRETIRRQRSFAGTPFGFTGLENRIGWTAAAVEWAFSQHWSASVEYDYISSGTASCDVRSDQRFPGQCGRQAEHQVIKVGRTFTSGVGW